jgi:hypothetical protein
MSLALLASTALAAPKAPYEKRTLPTTSTNQQTINSLLLAATGRDRIALLPNDNDFIYDFANPPTQLYNSSGKGGFTIAANRKTMPSLIGTGSSMSVGFLGPCGFNTPHTHPRGTELNIVVQGSLMTTMILENEARAVSNPTNLYQMAVFPQGALHQEFNPGCEPTVFVAAFNNEDAGTLQTMNAFFELPDDVIQASFGGDVIISGQDVDLVRGMIPMNVAKGVEECLTKCNIPKRKR